MLAVYVPLYFGIILLSGLIAKNFGREFHAMSYWLGLLFLPVSVLAETLAFVIRVENTLFGFLQILLILSISNVALVTSTLHIIIYGERASLRENIRLTDDFFGKQKKIWKDELDGFPNLNNILDNLDDGRFVASLFDRGSFNLAVLWSCNLMEKIIDTAAEGIISKNPPRRPLFKKEDGGPQRYPLQLRNLGYEPRPEAGSKNEQIDIETLWHKIRNDVAHRNYKPTFHETYGALRILVSFTEEMPRVLQAWKTS
jgi:hypothetical protein